MPTIAHFIDVGQGNMTLLQLSNGKIFLYDCNVTDENADRVLAYLGSRIGWGTGIDVFVNSHRDADHIRGVKRVHEYFPIQHVWDSGVTGNTTDCTEYLEYMGLRRQVGFSEIAPRKYWDYGNTRLRVLNSKNDDLADDPNAQGIVMMVVHRDALRNINYHSALLTADTDAVTWKDIRRHYPNDQDLACTILVASHHGSATFFDDPSDEANYYIGHIRAMSPRMTLVSVGSNGYGHPDPNALRLYEKHSHGSPQGHKIWRTDRERTMRLDLTDDGGWWLTPQAI